MDLAGKLQLRAEQAVHVVGMTSDTVPALSDLELTELDSHDVALLVFVANRGVLEQWQPVITDAAHSGRLTWVAYPKAGQLGTDLNRDSLAAILRGHGSEPVRQVAIDTTWSALRFRGS